ncbi:uncharacterized protein FOMMEDRAFT_103315 [Fomitiporia mediterranea MF3/22]|uniref:uncharacterized protein n=1 Tax=Fomitiporia mediterranea (strain MF3/22) TaxID=694068 RepID=UPI0004407A2C|nr:uncharacterized protein FOMMEDRAFT_103315 [Fomitiporia mediterranea MF3/22]EJD05326.1 hypothetical protein FOMMEDRAFT_103315 [Fomitiporia mediterranea MF3/22]
MAQQNIPRPPERLLVFGTVSFYMVAALSMVMANKWVLNKTAVPLFFLLTQLLIAVSLFSACHGLGLLKVSFHIDLALIKGLAPMIILNCIGLSFSNFTLKYVDASFYQVARGLVLPFTVATSAIFLSARPSRAILFACAIVTTGFFIGVFLDGVHVNAIGVFFGVASSAVTALHAVVIKRAIKLLNDSALDLCWYTNLLSACVLSVVVILAGEAPGVSKLVFGDSGVLRTFIWGSLITGLIGFLMGIASTLSIKITSPITHMVSSAVRGVAATFLGMWFFYDVVTSGRAASIAIILGGSIYYTWIKHVESQQPPAASSEKAYERIPMDEVEAGKAESRNRPE